jgi:hypothetical protein
MVSSFYFVLCLLLLGLHVSPAPCAYVRQTHTTSSGSEFAETSSQKPKREIVRSFVRSTMDHGPLHRLSTISKKIIRLLVSINSSMPFQTRITELLKIEHPYVKSFCILCFSFHYRSNDVTFSMPQNNHGGNDRSWHP